MDVPNWCLRRIIVNMHRFHVYNRSWVLAMVVGLTLLEGQVAWSLPSRHKPFPSSIPSYKLPVVDSAMRTKYALPSSPRSSSTLQFPKAQVRDLGELVGLQQRHFPGAVVTSGFYDWRTVSRYRSHAGLHFGYDIAMPYGCPFSAGWPGTVVAIAVWSGEEHGITVQHDDGMTVTYGHVSPRVSVGHHVVAGEVLGTIARDHLDVKMRDAAGNYFDFGGSARVVAAPSWASGSWSNPRPSKEALMAEWLVASNAVDLAQEELTQIETQRALKKAEMQQLQHRIPALEKSVSMMGEYLEQGLVARVTAEENREELEKAKERLKVLQKTQVNGASSANFQRNLQMAKERLSVAKKSAIDRGISWKNVESFVGETVSNNARLKKDVEVYQKNALSKNSQRITEMERKIVESDKELKTLEELFEVGGVARNDVQTARTKNQLLHRQKDALLGQTKLTN